MLRRPGPPSPGLPINNTGPAVVLPYRDPPRPLSVDAIRRRAQQRKAQADRRTAVRDSLVARRAAEAAGMALSAAQELARNTNAAAVAAQGEAKAKALEAGLSVYNMLEEYSGLYFDWAVRLLSWARKARNGRLDELEAIASATTLSERERAEQRLLRRNAVVEEALANFGKDAPEEDALGRRGQYLGYRKGGKKGEGKGRHFPQGGYHDCTGEWRQANLQGCPKEVRIILASSLCRDLDFVNSLPTVASHRPARKPNFSRFQREDPFDAPPSRKVDRGAGRFWISHGSRRGQARCEPK